MIDIEEGLTDKQIKTIRESNKRINLSDGAVRAGKTVGFNLRWLEYVLSGGPPGDLLMVGKTERALKRNILNPMQALLGTKYMKIVSGASEVYIGGRKIYTVGANDERAVGKIQGSTLAGALGDEVGLWPESFFAMLLSRLSVKNSKFFGTTNPEGPYHWLKKKYIDRRHHLNLGRWHFHIDDNDKLDPEYVESLKKEYTGVFYSRYIRGLWVLAEGLVYQIPPTMGQVRDPLSFDSFIVGVDYGTSNPTTYGLYGFDKGRPPVYLVKEYFYDGGEEKNPQKTDSDYATELEEFIKPVKNKIEYIYVDPSALSFITEIKNRRGMPWVKQAKNDVLPGIRFTAGLINKKLYLVDSSCGHTKKGYVSYLWDKKAQERGEDKPLKQDDHVCDRDRYALFSHFYKKAEFSNQKYWK